MPRRAKVEPPEPPPGWPSICGGAATCAKHVPKPEWEPRRGTWVARCDMIGPPPKCRLSYHHVFWDECLCVIFKNDVFNVFLLTLKSGRANLCRLMYMSTHESKNKCSNLAGLHFLPHPYPRTTRTWMWTNRISDDRPNIYDSWTRLERIWERMGPAFVFRNQVRICSYHQNQFNPL